MQFTYLCFFFFTFFKRLDLVILSKPFFICCNLSFRLCYYIELEFSSILNFNKKRFLI